MRNFKLCLMFLAVIAFSGCYEGKIKKAYTELKIGSSKSEVNRLFHEFKFLKERTARIYPNLTEKDTRASIWGDNDYEDIQPGKKEVISAITFDGETKIYAYLIDKESNWPNNTGIYYVAIFYDQRNDKVIGKAIMFTTDDPSNWNEKF